MPTETSFYIA